MPFTEEDKILINNLFDLKGQNGNWFQWGIWYCQSHCAC